MPIGRRQYEPALAFPGQRASYQDYTHGHNTQDECVNYGTTYLPYGRFVTKDLSPAAVATGLPGLLTLPSAATNVVVGFAPIQGLWENQHYGNGGIPPKQPMFYAYKGIYWVETITAIQRGDLVAIAADPATPANQGKIGNQTTLTGVKINLTTGQYRVLDTALAGGLVRIELDLPSTLLV
jgi:hypothetical protein